MAYPIYYVEESDTLPILFDTFDGGTGASITLTGLAVTDIEIYKDGSTTQRASDAGYTLLDTDGIDFDTITGIHGFSLDLSDNTDAGFYAVGSWYHVVVSSVTIDAQTVNFVAAAFRIVSATRGMAGTALPAAAADAAGGLVISDAGGLDIDTKLSTATSALATSSALSTAQADLDTLTGTDGVTLATSQPNYAPNTTTPPTAAAIADSVWDEPKADHTTSTTFGDLATDLDSVLTDTNSLNDTKIPDTISLANINAEVDTALATTTYAELGAVPAATSTLADKINWLFLLARNKLTQTSTTLTALADDTTTSVATSTVSDDGTTATRGEFS